MFLASKSFTANEHIRLLSDNATAIFYINKMEKENGDLSFDGLSLSNSNNMGVWAYSMGILRILQYLFQLKEFLLQIEIQEDVIQMLNGCFSQNMCN